MSTQTPFNKRMLITACKSGLLALALSFSLLGCFPRAAQVELETNQWSLTHYALAEDRSLSMDEAQREYTAADSPLNSSYTLVFEPLRQQVGGRLSCNLYFGGYAASNKLLRLGNLASTLMACPWMNLPADSPEKQMHNTIQNALGDTHSYEIINGSLIITADDGTRLRFEKIPEQSEKLPTEP